MMMMKMIAMDKLADKMSEDQLKYSVMAYYLTAQSDLLASWIGSDTRAELFRAGQNQNEPFD